ncbi:hypothetical protein N7G274_004478 [Stereocaulon virgatum]|uniref:Uncharacterized protein n=1 Tax=Stereocaulon virgatum TaxID=373712 RepID=A0ABR4AA11_9LECA
MGDVPSCTVTSNEPDWEVLSGERRVGYCDRQDRWPGLTHVGDEEEEEFVKKAEEEKAQLGQKEQKGELMNFRDIRKNQEDYHFRWPQKHPPGWRYVLDASEDWIKNKQDWAVNVQKRKKKQKQKDKEKESKKFTRAKARA